MVQNKKGNRQVSKKNLLLLDKYVKKEKKVKSEGEGNDKISPEGESKT